MIWYFIQKTLKTPPKKLRTINKFRKVVENKTNTQKLVEFLCIVNELPQKEIVKDTFTSISKGIHM